MYRIELASGCANMARSETFCPQQAFAWLDFVQMHTNFGSLVFAPEYLTGATVVVSAADSPECTILAEPDLGECA